MTESGAATFIAVKKKGIAFGTRRSRSTVKGFAFIDAPNKDEMDSIIRRFDRAPLEDRLLRANPAQPPRPKGAAPAGGPPGQGMDRGPRPYGAPRPQGAGGADRPPRRGGKKPTGGRRNDGPQSPFAEELTNALN